MMLTPPDKKDYYKRDWVLEDFFDNLLWTQVFDTKKGFGVRTGSWRMRYKEIMEQIDPANRPFIERRCLGLPLDNVEDKRYRLGVLARR